MTILKKTALIGAVVLVIAACGDDAESISVEGAWARNSASTQTAGAAYFVITSPIDDALVNVTVDPSIAGEAQIHEVVMAETTDTTMGDMSTTTMGMSSTTMGMSDTTMGGMGGMTMREIDQLALPAGEAVTLEPGGYHVMLLDLVAPLEVGQTFDITLQFEHAADLVVQVEVREDAA